MCMHEGFLCGHLCRCDCTVTQLFLLDLHYFRGRRPRNEPGPTATRQKIHPAKPPPGPAVRCRCRAGCIFTGWRGGESPLIINYGALTHVHNTVFHDTHLAAELVDVSFDGTVRFSNVSLANVTLDRGAVVSTTNNDYEAPQGAVSNFLYYAEDDEAYDVEVEVVPAAAAGVFGAEFGIADAVMSDCVFLAILPRTTVMPGCPESSAQQRARMLAQFDGAEDDETLLRQIEPVSRLRDDMLAADDEWLVRTTQVCVERRGQMCGLSQQIVPAWMSRLA